MAFYISSMLLIGFGPTDDVTIPDHYCGLYATHAALKAVGLVFGHHYDPKLREIAPDEIKRIVRDRTHLIVDCRFASDYAAGHIPTARNLPVTSGPAQQMAFLKDHPTSTKVVVYCQSPSCNWAKSFGSAIYHFGYRDTAIFVGGFSAWNKDDGQ